MRIYIGFREALDEIKRDLKEMGTTVHPRTVQDQQVGGSEEDGTLELQNYIYCVTQGELSQLKPTEPWVTAEWYERACGLLGDSVNPGTAWELRRKVWEQFLHDGKFSYTYADRFSRFDQYVRLLDRMLNDPESRQLYLSVWDPSDIENIGGNARVPCTLGYLFQIRGDKLDITYLQRSADFATHLENDIFLAHMLQRFMATKIRKEPGKYFHWIGSLHVFKKDVKGVF